MTAIVLCSLTLGRFCAERVQVLDGVVSGVTTTNCWAHIQWSNTLGDLYWMTEHITGGWEDTRHLRVIMDAVS